NEIDWPNVGRRDLYRLSTATCGDDGVPAASEHPSRDLAQCLLVIDDKDGLGSQRERGVIASSDLVSHGIMRCDREKDGYRCADTLIGVDPRIATGLQHDSVDGR